MSVSCGFTIYDVEFPIILENQWSNNFQFAWDFNKLILLKSRLRFNGALTFSCQ